MSGSLTALSKVPEIMRPYKQWVVASADKMPLQVDGTFASVNDPFTWTTFEAASEAAQAHGLYVGFVLTTADPFVCLDLDCHPAKENKPAVGMTDDAKLRHEQIIASFGSYTEVSLSGNGYHVFLRTEDPELRTASAQRDSVAVYACSRMIVMTGNGGGEMASNDELLSQLVQECQGTRRKFVLDDQPQLEADTAIWEKAANAHNADKFLDLCEGRWEDYNYPSQSEADHALMRMLAFWSPNNEQVMRMFRATALGARVKAQRDEYLLRSIHAARAEIALETHNLDNIAGLVEKVSVVGPSLATEALDWPPGRAGELAQWLYSIAPRPVKEVAIITTLGILAGVFGRYINVSKSGLNLYLVLVAKSGIGKEAMHTGTSRIVHEILCGVNKVDAVFDFSVYASGQALNKGIADKLTSINLCGEWGRLLQQMALDTGPAATLRTAMTHLYQKSGYGNVVGGLSYSDKEKNTSKTFGVCYSMMGETTPETFYQALTDSMLSDGFLSRFVVIEYNGSRPPLNRDMDDPPPEWMVPLFENIMNTCQDPGYKPLAPTYEPGALEMLDEWGTAADALVNGEEFEGKRQAYSRSHLKMLKISALLAAVDSGAGFCHVTKEHAAWAMNVVKRDINTMLSKIDSGEVGNGDEARLRKVRTICQEYLQSRPPKSYNVLGQMHRDRVITRQYLQARVAAQGAFSQHRLGSTNALDAAVKNLCDNGELVEVSRHRALEDYKFMGKCYKIIKLA